MISLLQGCFGSEQVKHAISDALNQEEVDKLLTCILNEPLKYRNRAVAILSYYRHIRAGHIASFLRVSHSSVDEWTRTFAQRVVQTLLPLKSESVRLRTSHTETRFLKYCTLRHQHTGSTGQHGGSRYSLGYGEAGIADYED